MDKGLFWLIAQEYTPSAQGSHESIMVGWQGIKQPGQEVESSHPQPQA